MVGKNRKVVYDREERTLVTEDSVRAAHAAGLEVHVWTVNRREDIEELLALQVDGVMSDYPDLLLEWQAEHEEGQDS